MAKRTVRGRLVAAAREAWRVWKRSPSEDAAPRLDVSEDAADPAAGDETVSGADREAVKLWAKYAEKRFRSADARIEEYRGAARQLVAAIGIVMGLEGTIVARLALDEHPPLDGALRAVCLLVFVLVLAVQVELLSRLLSIGYRGDRVVGPESPTVLATYFSTYDEMEAYRVVGAYYAKAHDTFHALSESLGERVGKASRRLQYTLGALLVAVALLVVGALWNPVGSDTKASIAEESTPNPTPAPATPTATGASEQPAAQPTTTSPLLTTPTTGQEMNKAGSGDIGQRQK
jgi:hypothetical protein